jgi:site-specific recombinase XerD
MTKRSTKAPGEQLVMDKVRPPRSNKGRKFPPEVLTRDEVRMLMRLCNHRVFTGARNQAMIGTMYRTGVRVRELVSLRMQDYNREKQTLRVVKGKGGKSRTLAVDADLVLVLDQWLGFRARLGDLDKSEPLFLTLTGDEIATQYVRKFMRRLRGKSGIGRRCNPHSLRHTFAAELHLEGVDLVAIMRMLGHVSLATTEKYLRGIDADRLSRQAIERRGSWRN